MQKDLVEQKEQHERNKKGLQNKLKNEKTKHQREIKDCKEKIEDLENEMKIADFLSTITFFFNFH